jgi:uncharacterized RDD family membrane protein YckC
VTAKTRAARARRLRGRRAGIVSRIIADGIDLVTAAAILFGLLLAFSIVRYMASGDSFRLPRVGALFTAVWLPVVQIVYLAAAWSTSGRSLGKDIVGLRVVRNDGRRLGRGRAIARAVVCTLFGGPSLLWAMVSKRNAAVHDLVLNTAVVYDWPDTRARRRQAEAAAAVELDAGTDTDAAPSEAPVLGTPRFSTR